MKKSEWEELAKYLWSLSKVKPKMAKQLQELIIAINENTELIYDDIQETSNTNGSTLRKEADNTSSPPFKGNGEF